MIDVIDLFSGAGGFSLGAHRVTDSVVGIELNGDACDTQTEAGMACNLADITALDPSEYFGWSGPLHLHASPPCTTFSAAGKGHGRNSIEVLQAAAYDILTYGLTDVVLDDIDDTTKLVLEPARWIHELTPDTISFEQVRAVLPVWESYAAGLKEIGYHVWTGLLHAEQYGVPQSRVRAWLMASKHRPVSPPRPTHSKYHPRNPTKLDEGVLPWVSMAEALGFPMTARPAYTVTAGGTDTGGAELFGNGARKGMRREEEEGRWTHYAPAGVSQKSHPAQPRRLDSAVAPTVTSVGNHHLFDPEVDAFGENLQLKNRRDSDGWIEKHGDRPNREAEAVAPTMTGEAFRWEWEYERPSTTVCGDPRLSGPGRNDPNVSGSQYGKNARKITVAEAGVLQGFPADYPWQGTRTSQFKQAGNAVPPPVAEAVLRSLL